MIIYGKIFNSEGQVFYSVLKVEEDGKLSLAEEGSFIGKTFQFRVSDPTDKTIVAFSSKRLNEIQEKACYVVVKKSDIAPITAELIPIPVRYLQYSSDNATAHLMVNTELPIGKEITIQKFNEGTVSFLDSTYNEEVVFPMIGIAENKYAFDSGFNTFVTDNIKVFESIGTSNVMHRIVLRDGSIQEQMWRYDVVEANIPTVPAKSIIPIVPSISFLEKEILSDRNVKVAYAITGDIDRITQATVKFGSYAVNIDAAIEPSGVIEFQIPTETEITSVFCSLSLKYENMFSETEEVSDGDLAIVYPNLALLSIVKNGNIISSTVDIDMSSPLGSIGIVGLLMNIYFQAVEGGSVKNFVTGFDEERILESQNMLFFHPEYISEIPNVNDIYEINIPVTRNGQTEMLYRSGSGYQQVSDDPVMEVQSSYVIEKDVVDIQKPYTLVAEVVAITNKGVFRYSDGVLVD